MPGDKPFSKLQPDSVEEQYSGDVELYAHVRAETARALGRETDARKWEQVEAEASDGHEDEAVESD